MVKKGDTVFGVARANNVSLEALRAANGMAADETHIEVGQALKIPKPGAPAAVVPEEKPIAATVTVRRAYQPAAKDAVSGVLTVVRAATPRASEAPELLPFNPGKSKWTWVDGPELRSSSFAFEGYDTALKNQLGAGEVAYYVYTLHTEAGLMELVYPKWQLPGKPPVPVEELVEAINKIPPSLRKGTRVVYVDALNQVNRDETHAAWSTGDAIGIDQDFKVKGASPRRFLLHEFAHCRTKLDWGEPTSPAIDMTPAKARDIWANWQATGLVPQQRWTLWEAAVVLDRAGPTDYARVNIEENVAELVAEMWTSGKRLVRNDIAHRAQVLEALLGAWIVPEQYRGTPTS